VFSLRYGLNSWILFSSSSGFKELSLVVFSACKCMPVVETSHHIQFWELYKSRCTRRARCFVKCLSNNLYHIINSTRNRGLEVPLYFLKAKQGYAVRKIENINGYSKYWWYSGIFQPISITDYKGLCLKCGITFMPNCVNIFGFIKDLLKETTYTHTSYKS
jgi:hypothetical protein